MPHAAPPPKPAAQVQLLVGADLWTSKGLAKGQAVALKGDKVAAVGPEAKLLKLYPKADRVQLQGGTLLPGFIEGHAHVLGLGAKSREVDLGGVQDLPEALGRIRDWTRGHADAGSGGWVLGRGWDQNLWPSKAFPTAVDLDRVVGTRPALLRRVDGHAAWLNSAALLAAGIDEKTPDPSGGRILRGPDGRPTGVLIDAAMDLVDRKVPQPSAEEVEARLLDGLKALRAQGFTATTDMGIDEAVLAAYRHLDEEGRLPIRVFAYLSHDEALMERELKAAKGKAKAKAPAGPGMFRLQGVKFYMDGALGSRGARLLAPYADAPDTTGLWVTDPARVAKGVEFTFQAGYQPAIHAIGDAANREALNLLANARKKFPKAPMPRIEHAQIVTPEDAQRFGKLGVVASVQPVHCTSDHAWTPERLGPDRVREAYPWRSFLEGGALLAFGSDAPVEDPNPYIALAAAETREDPEGDPPGGFLPEQRLSRDEALKAYTEGNARALGRPDLGTVQAGSAADLLWVASPLLDLSAQELRKVQAGKVWVAGHAE